MCIRDSDRGGLVGEDGPTHHGVFDFSFLRPIPNIIIMSPKDENEMQQMIKSAFSYNAPVVVRYPRGKGVGVPMEPFEDQEIIPLGKGEIMCRGKDLCIMAIGSMVYPSILAAEELTTYGISAYVVNMRFVKPLDRELILEMANKTHNIVTVEENVVAGGFGTAIQELLNENGVTGCVVQHIGLPDKFIEQGNMNQLREKYRLDAGGIVLKIREAMQFLYAEKSLK